MTSDEAAMLTTAYKSSIRQVGWQMVAARALRAAATSSALRHVLAIIFVVAAVLARAPLGRAEATERRSCELDRLGCPCSQRVILPSLCVSCAPLLEAHGTLVCAILACVLRYARTCAAAVAALPLRRSRWIARPQTPLAAVDGSGNGDLHVCAV